MIDKHSPQSGELGHFPNLPLDVLANIIGELDPHDPRDAYTLRSLSLSCRSAVHFSQMALFKSVDLVLSSRGSFSQRVLRLKSVVSSPRIAQYVRHFKIVLDVREQDYSPEISTAPGELGNLLPNLKDIHGFTLRYAFLKSLVQQKMCLDWCSLDPAFRGAVEGVIASPTLVHLQIARVEKFPLDVFLEHASWIDLVVEEPYVIDIRIVSPLKPGSESMDTDVSGVHRTITHVRSYSVAEGSRASWPFDETYRVRPNAVLITGFDYLFNLSNLPRASVCWWHRGAARDTLHVVPIQPSLRSFACTVNNKEMTFSGLAQILLHQPLPNLTALRLSTTKYFRWARHGGPFYHLPEEFALLAGYNVLESISVSVAFGTVARTIEDCELERFDQPFTKTGFPFLKSFDLVLYFWTTADPAHPAALTGFDINLSCRIVQINMISMDMHVRHPRLQVTGREKGTTKGERIHHCGQPLNQTSTQRPTTFRTHVNRRIEDTRIRVVRYSDSSTLHSALTDVEDPTSAN